MRGSCRNSLALLPWNCQLIIIEFMYPYVATWQMLSAPMLLQSPSLLLFFTLTSRDLWRELRFLFEIKCGIVKKLSWIQCVNHHHDASWLANFILRVAETQIKWKIPQKRKLPLELNNKGTLQIPMTVSRSLSQVPKWLS